MSYSEKLVNAADKYNKSAKELSAQEVVDILKLNIMRPRTVSEVSKIVNAQYEALIEETKASLLSKLDELGVSLVNDEDDKVEDATIIVDSADDEREKQLDEREKQLNELEEQLKNEREAMNNKGDEKEMDNSGEQTYMQEFMGIPQINLGAKTIRTLNETVNKIIGALVLQDACTTNEEIEEVIDSGKEISNWEELNSSIVGIDIDKIKTALEYNMSIMLTGVPGCGKTFAAGKIAEIIAGNTKTNRIKQIEFNESTDYSDMIVGLRHGANGRWTYEHGEIARFCEFANRNKNKKFVLILNEFTRANAEAVLGEMFTAMESRYRDVEYKLADNTTFVCPSNLVIMATMNGTDRGVKKLDMATEERFYILNVKPLWDEWATSNEQFNRLTEMINCSDDTIKNKLLALCEEMSKINDIIGKSKLKSELQIGQRQLLMFIGSEKEFGEKELEFVVEQLANRIDGIARGMHELDNKFDKERFMKICQSKDAE